MAISQADLARIDQAIKTQLDVLRHSASVESQVLQILERMRGELIAKLAQGDLTTWGKARLNELLRDTTTTINEYYSHVDDLLRPTYSAVAEISATQTAAALAVTAPSNAVLKSLVSNMLIEGAPSREWWSKTSKDTSFKFSSAIRQGVAQGETMSQIFRRVNATVDLAGRNSTALVHTSVMQVLNDARMQVMEDNADDDTQMQYLSALDSHVCLRCAPRDGLRWYVKSKKPVGHTLEWKQPPIHFACRCTAYEKTVFTDMEGGGRASQFGVVEGRTTFDDVLKRLSAKDQNEVLGKGRADMYRSGKITLRDLVSGNGSPLTISELKAKYLK